MAFGKILIRLACAASAFSFCSGWIWSHRSGPSRNFSRCYWTGKQLSYVWNAGKRCSL